MVGQLDDLDEAALLERAADDEPAVDELLPVGVVDLVAVAVALGDHRLVAVDLAGARVRARARRPARRGASCRRGPRPPSAPGSRSITGMRRLGIHLGRVGAVEPAHVARELGDGDVHAEADAEVRDRVLARDAAGEDLPLPAARAEAAGDEHAVDAPRARRAPPRASCSRRRPSARARGSRAWMPACLSASCTERYASWSFTYLPTSAISTDSVALARCARSARPTRRGPARGASRPSFSQTSSSSPCSRSAERARGRRRARRSPRSRRRRRRRRRARSCRGCRACSGSVERQTSTSGWIPMRRSSLTECCVGFVFSSPAVSMNGTSVTWR